MVTKKEMRRAAQKRVEDKETTLPQTALPVAAAPTNLKLDDGLQVKRHITLPSFTVKEASKQRTFFIMDAMRISQIKSKKDDEQKRDPATICTVVDMDTGEHGTFIVPAVVKANLERDYPEAGYVGKAFAIINKGKRTEAQRYNDFAIYEVGGAKVDELAKSIGK